MIDRTTIALGFVALALAVLAGASGGAELAAAGLIAGGKMLLSVVPLLLAAFLVAGLVQVLLSREAIDRWLGTESGVRGIVLACVAGALTPGGPYVYYPIAGALLKSGASLGVLVAFVSAKNLWSITRLPYEFALLGPRLTIIRLAVTLIVPPLLGFVAESLFGSAIERIRAEVAS